MANFFIHFIINNWLTLSVLFGLIIVAARHQNMNKNTALTFILAAVCCFLTTIASGLDIYYGKEAFTTLNPLRVVGSLFAYALKPLPSIFVLFFILKIETKKQRWIFGLFCIPALINIIFCMLSFPFGENMVCYFTSDNHWHPGLLSNIPSITGYFYIALIVIICIYRAIKRDFDELFVVLFMMFIVIVASIMEFEVGDEEFIIFDSSLINGTTSIGLTFIYFHLYITRNKIDKLTGLNNRGTYYYDMKKYKSKVTAIVSLDMNNLKVLNDTQGHNAGDLGLSTIGKIIAKSSKGHKAYRVGGDEFIIVCFKAKEEDVISIINIIKAQLLETSYSVAIGYSMVGGENYLSIDDALRIADTRMYNEKRAVKEKLTSA